MAVSVFLDTSVLLAGLIELGPQGVPAQSILHGVAEESVPGPGTAWHCCLEFFSVATRLPPQFRLEPADAVRLLESEVFGRMAVHALPPGERAAMLRLVVEDRIAGGRVYDVHIAEIARAAGAKVVVTDNRRHFLSALRHGLRVETPAEFLEKLKQRRS